MGHEQITVLTHPIYFAHGTDNNIESQKTKFEHFCKNENINLHPTYIFQVLFIFLITSDTVHYNTQQNSYL